MKIMRHGIKQKVRLVFLSPLPYGQCDPVSKFGQKYQLDTSVQNRSIGAKPFVQVRQVKRKVRRYKIIPNHFHIK